MTARGAVNHQGAGTPRRQNQRRRESRGISRPNLAGLIHDEAALSRAVILATPAAVRIKEGGNPEE